MTVGKLGVVKIRVPGEVLRYSAYTSSLGRLRLYQIIVLPPCIHTLYDEIVASETHHMRL